MTLAPLSALDAALGVLRGASVSAGLAGASDGDVLELARLAAEVVHAGQACAALAAGEIDRRSAPSLGAAGLARRSGARTTQELLTSTGRVTGRDAATAIRVGRLATESGPFAPVGAAVAAGEVSVEAADAIRSGLDGLGSLEPTLVSQAATLLCAEAKRLDPDRLRVRAREVRDELDAAGVADREAALRSRRSLRRIDLRDGMKRLVWDYDPETAGIVDEVYDRITSPRRGGPRFVDAGQARHARDVERDVRTTEQLASDGFAELLRQSASVDSGVLVGSGVPSVRVIVSAEQLDSDTGYGVVEGTGAAFSRATVERIACATGTQAVLVDSAGDVLDLGREQRLYSARQRVALAVRDGGCRWSGCDRPPSWTEAHHIDHWARDGGRTDVARGILLCRHHHLRLHNEGWAIRRDDGGRWWLDPPGRSPGSSVLLETKSRAMREHLRRSADASASAGVSVRAGATVGVRA